MTKHVDGAWVAEMYGIPEATVAQWRYKGYGPPWYRIGRHVRYDPAEVEVWFRAQRGGRPQTAA